MADEVLSRRQGAVRVLTLNRPDRLNAVNLALYEALIGHLEDAAADPSVRCVVLTGAGRAFCSGADLKAHRDASPGPEERTRYVEAAQQANRLIQAGRVPVVAAVNGPAVGAGLELALSADFLLVAEDARLRLPEISLGTFIGGGVSYTLSERIGVLKARELIYLGEFFSGREAVEMGLANRAVAAGRVLEEALGWAERLARLAPLPVAAAKRLIGPASTMAREAALAKEKDILEEIFETEDWREGVEAFHAGREPGFKGE